MPYNNGDVVQADDRVHTDEAVRTNGIRHGEQPMDDGADLGNGTDVQPGNGHANVADTCGKYGGHANVADTCGKYGGTTAAGNPCTRVVSTATMCYQHATHE